MTSRASRILDIVIVAMAVLAGTLIVLSIVSLLAEVIMRYFIGRPLDWVVEYNEIGLLYITFLAAPWVLRSEGHVTVDLVLNAVSPRVRALLTVFSSILGIIVTMVLVIYGTEVTLDFFERGVKSMSLLEIPRGPVVAIIPLGSLVLMLQFCRRGYQAVQDWQQAGERSGQAEPDTDSAQDHPSSTN